MAAYRRSHRTRFGSKSGFSIDTGDFDRGFRQLVKKSHPAVVKAGLKEAAIQLLEDYIELPPTVPMREGVMRGSGSAFVDGKLVGTSAHLGKGGSPARTHQESWHLTQLSKTGYRASIGFYTSPQAAWLHENPDLSFTEPGSGAKYMERKLQDANKYVRIIAETMRKGLDRKGARILGISRGARPPRRIAA